MVGTRAGRAHDPFPSPGGRAAGHSLGPSDPSGRPDARSASAELGRQAHPGREEGGDLPCDGRRELGPAGGRHALGRGGDRHRGDRRTVAEQGDREAADAQLVLLGLGRVALGARELEDLGEPLGRQPVPGEPGERRGVDRPAREDRATEACGGSGLPAAETIATTPWACNWASSDGATFSQTSTSPAVPRGSGSCRCRCALTRPMMWSRSSRRARR